MGVGEVVRCRPLGAVCLIDEGEADWKLLLLLVVVVIISIIIIISSSSNYYVYYW